MLTTIRKAEKRDSAEILRMITELADFEKSLPEVIISIEKLENDGFGSNPLWQGWIAESLLPNQGGKEALIVSGMAICYDRYSTWKGKCLYLEDLYVKQNCRGGKVGTLLFEEVLRFCKANGYSRLCWQVLDWNVKAIEFYKKFQPAFDGGWINGFIDLL